MVFAVGLAAAPILIVRFSPLGQVLNDWWESTTADQDEPDVYVEPLPGRPPRTSPPASPGHGSKDDGRVIVNPAWVVQPSPRFPDLATKTRVPAGRVELQCPVKADGTITSCWILSETPAGVGFGQAAVAAAAKARLSPRTVDGVPTAGMVRFSTAFRLE